MASRVELFDVTVPAGTTIAAPQTTATRFDSGVVERVEILVPPGPSGLVGFRIRHGGGSVWPREESKWIIADDEKISWDNDLDYTAGDWAVVAYNTDVYPHTLYLRYLVREVARGAPRPATPLVIEQPNQPAPAPEDEMVVA